MDPELQALLEYLEANPWAASVVQADLQRPPAQRQVLTTTAPADASRISPRGRPAPQAPRQATIGPREGSPMGDALREHAPGVASALRRVGRAVRSPVEGVGRALENVTESLGPVGEVLSAWGETTGLSPSQAIRDLNEFGPGALAEIGPLKIAGRTIRRVLGNGKHLDISIAGDRFTATIDGKQAAVGSLGRQGDQTFVQDLLVPQAMRRQGIGRAVFDGLEEATGGLTRNPGVKSPGGEAVEESFFNARQAGDAAAPPPESIADPEMLTLRHFGYDVENLPYLDPTRHGTGQAGAEARRRASYPDEYLPRTFFYEEGAQVEPRFQGVPSVEVQVPRSAIASGEDIQAAVRQAAEELGEPGGPGVVTRAERILQGQGFEGYSQGGVVQKFTPTPLVDRPFLASIYDPENPGRFFVGANHADAEEQIARSIGMEFTGGMTPTQMRRLDEARAGLVEGFYDTRGRTNLTREDTAGRLGRTGRAHSDDLNRASVDDTAARMIAGEDGGFTLNPVTGESAAGRDAWAVAPRKDTEKVFTRPPTPAEIRAYREEWGDLLSEEGAHLGGWHDKDTDRYVLDVSKIYDDEAAAIQAAAVGQQDAIFHLGTFETKPVDARAVAGAIGDSYGDAVGSQLRGERVVNAAYRTPEGKVLTGPHHGAILDENGHAEVEFPFDDLGWEGGFVTNTGRYIDREEAARMHNLVDVDRAGTEDIFPERLGLPPEGAAGDNVGVSLRPRFQPQERGVFDRSAPPIQGTQPTDPRIRPEAGARASVSDLVDAIRSSRTIPRLLDQDVERGMSMGGPEWYELGPIKADLDARGGEGGALSFQQFNAMGAGSSLQNSVPGELSAMSIANFARKRGISLDEAKRIYKEETRGAPFPMLSQQHMDLGVQGVERGAVVPSQANSSAWKIPSYYDKRMGGGGSLDPEAPGGMPALDTHELRRIMQGVMENPRLARVARQTGADRAAAADSGRFPLRNALDYQAISGLYTDGARRFGLPTAGAYQAPRWLGGGKHTGLQTSPVGDFVQLLEDQLLYTAQQLGRGDSPRELRDLWGEVVQGDAFILPWGSNKPLPLKPQSPGLWE